MKLANKAYVVTLILLMLAFTVTAQKDLKSDKDSRNTAPTVGTGGPAGGPTGLFTVYDQETLRKGEYTFSIAYSNYDRDPGNVDITEVPISFHIGVSHHLELFVNTDAWRGVKVNAPANLSSFYLPNSQLLIGGVLTSPAAVVLAPQGPLASLYTNAGVFRPQGMPFAQFPYTGSSAGNYGAVSSGAFFGFTPGTNATLGPPRVGGASDLFPGVGSPYGSILPGIVLTTTVVNCVGTTRPCGTAPVSFTNIPTYLPDAPFINRTFGQTAFNSLTFGGKWRLNSPSAGWGHGLIAYYKWYLDNASDAGGFNQMQRGSGSGSNKGDIGVGYFIGSRVAEWANVSANATYVYTSKVKGNFGGTNFVMFDPADQLQLSVGADFPVNRFFQPILEYRWLKYVGGHTPNALEQDPMDAIGGIRMFPRRWFGLGIAYRWNVNQQSKRTWDGNTAGTTVILPCIVGEQGCGPATVTNTISGVPPGLLTSTDPHGFIFQFWAGRRDKRGVDVVNQAASVDSVSLSDTVITLPCRPGYHSKSGACNDNKVVDVNTTAHDPENDVLTYNYTVSGGRIVGQGAAVKWDLSGAQAGTYTITTGVDDGCGVCGKTDTRTIKVEECPDCIQNCDCGTVSATGPSGLTNPGDSMTFTGLVSGGTATPTYNWSVSSGTITSGQGTSSITVATTKEMAGTTVTATLEIGGTDPACNCPTTASASADINKPEIGRQVDEFGKLPDDEVKARVDNFYIQLNNNPTAQGYIVNYGTPAEIKKRRAQIMKAITFLKKDPSRVTFIDGPDKGTGINTTFWVVPSGAVPPTAQ